jgi:hypothetical protein
LREEEEVFVEGRRRGSALIIFLSRFADCALVRQRDLICPRYGVVCPANSCQGVKADYVSRVVDHGLWINIIPLRPSEFLPT